MLVIFTTPRSNHTLLLFQISTNHARSAHSTAVLPGSTAASRLPPSLRLSGTLYILGLAMPIAADL